MRQCGVCGTQAGENTRFCPTCGSEMRSELESVDAGEDAPYESAERVKFCTQCGAVLDPGNRFCGACGAGVWEGARSAIPSGHSFLDDPVTMSTLCHLSAFASFFMPLGNIVGPLVIWLLRKDVLPSVDKHGKAALNFNISIAIYAAIGMAVSVALMLVVIGFLLIFVVIAVVFVLWLVATVIASVKAGNGEFWDYPLSIRFLR
ncbi:MAG: DUF4870 domain-containing protein [Chloroflexi bacterium]|nr:DUF4870 domain-containing protein [Chloroflexota bacterium]